jgi:hypothetical protein
LQWLLDRQTVDGHLSVVPVDGAGPGDVPPAFDQQPIEVAALADACARAASVTGDPAWLAGVDMAIGWFTGDNDLGVPLFDPLTGGGCDGLTPNGVNRNQGAESTLALITTMQHDDAARSDRRSAGGADAQPMSRPSRSASGTVAMPAPTSA